MYKYRKFGDRYVLSIDNHEEIVSAIKAFCEEKHITIGTVSGIGAVSEATLRFLDPAIKNYVDGVFTEQMEISNLIGNISTKDGELYLHIHATFGRRDYTCIGGHLMSAVLNGACELVVEDFGKGTVGRKFDPETGLNLYDFSVTEA
ncbi:MAG: DNA-binding protein [Bacteroidales bacterium]|nr:DNA-binding protein [Bacteroidales bacterium]MBQ9174449.1 DNA-binding protein [Bacteroidales bacterium]MBQ9712944.1 DNA-binding protein [Bacteroidales bacterium]MBR6415755.1 DNA-binding protein [Bacteroidales bacterium]